MPASLRTRTFSPSALLSAVLPLLHGDVNASRALSWNLLSPFTGVFGGLSSAMAGLYLVGFAAPAFEAATCHVGEMRDPARSLLRAMLVSAAMAGLFFLVLPAVWLGVFGAAGLGQASGADLAHLLGPTFAPLFGALAKSAAIWFLVLNMVHGTLQPLAGASRTLSQLSEDGLLPRLVGRRNRYDAPHVAIVLTAAVSIVFLLAGEPLWMIAAANFTYLIGIALPSIAVWLLRRDAPDHPHAVASAQGHDHARRDGRARLADGDHIGVSTVRPASRPVRFGLGVLRFGVLPLAQVRRPARGPRSAGSPEACMSSSPGRCWR